MLINILFFIHISKSRLVGELNSVFYERKEIKSVMLRLVDL